MRSGSLRRACQSPGEPREPREGTRASGLGIVCRGLGGCIRTIPVETRGSCCPHADRVHGCGWWCGRGDCCGPSASRAEGPHHPACGQAAPEVLPPGAPRLQTGLLLWGGGCPAPSPQQSEFHLPSKLGANWGKWREKIHLVTEPHFPIRSQDDDSAPCLLVSLWGGLVGPSSSESGGTLALCTRSPKVQGQEAKISQGHRWSGARWRRPRSRPLSCSACEAGPFLLPSQLLPLRERKSGWPLGGALAPQMAGRGRLGLLGGVGCDGELDAVLAPPAPRQPPVPCLDPGLCLTLGFYVPWPSSPGASDL